MAQTSVFRRDAIPGGPVIVTETLPQASSVTIGYIVTSGSRDETGPEEGMAHFWEHMAFKGTGRRDARRIALEFDRLGGLANAYTSREQTCFYARVAAADLPAALDVLTDLVTDPTLDPQETEREKDVVIQEIGMIDEVPEDYLSEHVWSDIWQDAGVGHPIAGTADSVSAFGREALLDWRRINHASRRIMLAASGAVDHAVLVRSVAASWPASFPDGDRPERAPGGYRPCVRFYARESEQDHILLSLPGVSLSAPDRHAWVLLSNILGGGMSSRLFQEVRESRGLAYSVYSSLHSLSDDGVMQIYAGVDPSRTRETVEVVRGVLESLAAGEIGEEEVAHGRDQVAAMLLLAQESTEDRMQRLARNQILFGRYIPYEESVSLIRSVTLDDVRRVATRLLRPGTVSAALLGREPDETVFGGLPGLASV